MSHRNILCIAIFWSFFFLYRYCVFFQYCLKLGREEAQVAGLVSDCCVFNHNGSLVVCGCSDGSIRTLDMRYSECLDLWEAHSGPVSALHLTPDLNTCFSFGFDHKVRPASLITVYQIQNAILICILIHSRFQLCRHNMAQNGEPMWTAGLAKCCASNGHGTQAFALHQSGSHALVACGTAPPNIYQVRLIISYLYSTQIFAALLLFIAVILYIYISMFKLHCTSKSHFKCTIYSVFLGMLSLVVCPILVV